MRFGKEICSNNITIDNISFKISKVLGLTLYQTVVLYHRCPIHDIDIICVSGDDENIVVVIV